MNLKSEDVTLVGHNVAWGSKPTQLLFQVDRLGAKVRLLTAIVVWPGASQGFNVSLAVRSQVLPRNDIPEFRAQS